MEYRELAHESGIQNWGRVPALNTNPVFIDDLAEAVLEALPYVGSMAGSNPGDSMVPLGKVLQVYTYLQFKHCIAGMPGVYLARMPMHSSREVGNGY